MKDISKFEASFEIFSRWRQRNYEHSKCSFQLFDETIVVEKWVSVKDSGECIYYFAEIYSDGNGFTIYTQDK